MHFKISKSFRDLSSFHEPPWTWAICEQKSVRETLNLETWSPHTRPIRACPNDSLAISMIKFVLQPDTRAVLGPFDSKALNASI